MMPAIHLLLMFGLTLHGHKCPEILPAGSLWAGGYVYDVYGCPYPKINGQCDMYALDIPGCHEDKLDPSEKIHVSPDGTIWKWTGKQWDWKGHAKWSIWTEKP